MMPAAPSEKPAAGVIQQMLKLKNFKMPHIELVSH
jgi:hypothetical protein